MKSASCLAWAEALESIALSLARKPSTKLSVDPATRTTVDERVDYVADLVAGGRWLERKSAKKLAAIWGVKLGTVWDYSQQAVRMTRTDRGTREHARELALGRWTRLYLKALVDGELRAAAAAQTGWDKASGVVESGGAKVQLNIFADPRVAGAFRALGEALDQEPDPGTKIRVLGRLRAAMAGAAAGAPPALPAAQVIEVQAELVDGSGA